MGLDIFRSSPAPSPEGGQQEAPEPTAFAQEAPQDLPPGSATLEAVTPSGDRSGPPGSAIRLRGRGLEECSTVYFRFDGRVIGSARPDAHGAVNLRASVPSDAEPGRHSVTAACSPGGPSLARSVFVVREALHRSELVSRIPHPWEISLSAEDLAISAFAGLLLILLVALPAELFNSTLEENYEEVKAWFRRPREMLALPGGGRQGFTLAAFVLAGGVLYSALSSDFGFNWSTAALVLGLSIAVTVTTVGFGFPVSVYMRRRYGEWGRVAVLPGTLLVSVIFVAFSKLMGVHPGLLYGLLAGFTFRHQLSEKEQGRLTAGASVLVLAVCAAAWFAYGAVSALVSEPNPSFLLLTLEAALSGIFVIGLESLLIGLIPLTFLRGKTVMRWNRAVWAALFGLAASAFVLIFITPDTGNTGYNQPLSMAFASFAGLLALMSILFWAYFRYRPEGWKPRSLRTTVEGEFEDISRF